MTQRLPFILFDPSAPDTYDSSKHVGCIEFSLDIFGSAMDMAIAWTVKTGRLSDLVPVARFLCDSVVESACQSLIEQGDSVSCVKGCSHCCHYLVGVTAAEAFCLYREILEMPDAQQVAIISESINAAQAIAAKGLPDMKAAESDDGLRSELSRWYGELDISCPALRGDVCSMYQQRPLACRQCLATSQPDRCKADSAQAPDPVVLPVSIAKVLMKTADQIQQETSQIIPLALVLPWCDANASQEDLFDAELLAGTFVKNLQENISLQQAE
jgi:Fe-S-cluster containining protein